MKDYGGALKKLRKHFGYTQQQLAGKLSVSYQTVSKWETGTNQMDLDTVRVMCDVLGISLDAFIKVADGAEISAVLAPKPVDSPTQPVAPPTPVQPAEKPVQPAPAQPIQPVQPVQPVPAPITAPQPLQDGNNTAHKPIDKTAVILALVLLGVILVFIIATIAVFAPRSSSGLDDYLGGKGKTVTVSYDLNGGSGSMTSEQFKNGVVTMPSCSAKRKGYKFVGWSYDGKEYNAYDKIKGITESSITVTATWKPITYTISFGGFVGSGNMASIKAEYGKKVKLPKSNFTLAGEPMTYWYVSLNERYDDEDTVINLCDEDGDEITLQPSYNALSIYIKLDGNGGYGGESSLRTYSDDPAAVERFRWKKDGYTLVGWKCGDRTFRIGESFQFNTYRYNSYTATAVWESATYYLQYRCSVTGCDGGGSDYDEYKFGSGYVLRNPCESKHAGYELVGIYTDSYSSNLQQPGETPELSSSTSNYIYPIVSYKPIKFNTTIKCESDSGEKTYSDIYLWEYNTDIRDELSLSKNSGSVSKKTGYHVSGYKVYLNGTEYTGDMCKITTNTSDEIVVEFLQEINTYTVRYYMDEYIDVKVMYDEQFTLPTPPPVAGYVFDGWKINGTLYKAGEKISRLITSNGVTVQAEQSLTPITYTLQFDGDGSDAFGPVTLKYAQEYELPNNKFNKDGYVFIAWERNGQRFPVGYKASKLSAEQDAVVTLTAVWGAKYQGAGTEQSPYLVGTYEQLYNLHWFTASGTNNQKYYALSADIDCEGKPLYPICGKFIKTTLYRTVHGFAGVFDGKKHVISNADFKAYELYDKVYYGLFGAIVGAKVYDLGIDGYTIDIQSASNPVSAAPFAAVVENDTSNNTMISKVQIARVWTSGTMTVDKSCGGYFGGLVGEFIGGAADNCFAVGEINATIDGSATPYIGGFMGKSGGGQFTNVSIPQINRCYTDMDITVAAAGAAAKAYVGGFVSSVTDLNLYYTFVSGSATLSGGCVDYVIGSKSLQNYYYYQVYACSDYAVTVGGEAYADDGLKYDNASYQSLCSTEWLTSVMKLDIEKIWQISDDGLPTLRGFAVQPSYRGDSV